MRNGWRLGVDEIDRLLPEEGLSETGLHEIKPSAPTDTAATIGFALGLATRRLQRHPGALVWVQSARDVIENGRPYGWGLLPFGLDPGRLVTVESGNAADALWAAEESLKGEEDGRSSGVALVILGLVANPRIGASTGHPRNLDTCARRLALAAARGGTPCLLLSPPATPGLGSAQTRWRVARRPSPLCSEALDLQEFRGFEFSGLACALVGLERCRRTGLASKPFHTSSNASGRFEGLLFDLEWNDEAYRFRLLAPMADRAAERAQGGVSDGVLDFSQGSEARSWRARRSA